jgi:glyoxylase-like metal-dependent hydrolase (beta-lactamase superfamily II)
VVHRISIPLERNAAVNVWLLLGQPLTLVDTGPVADLALASLETGLAEAGARVEDIELVLVTHHHADHSGLAAQIQRRAGARVCAHEKLAAYLLRFSERVAEEKEFFRRFLAEHGVPEHLRGTSTGYWRWLEASSEDCAVDLPVADGDVVVAGGRSLRVIHRPGHSETDTLFVDAAGGVAFVGDHLLTTPAYAEQGPRTTRPLGRYLENLNLLAQADPGTLHTGHGDDVDDVRAAVAARVTAAERRCERIAELLRGGALTAFEVAVALWPDGRVEWDPVIAVSEVVGHLELLVERGAVSEQAGSGTGPDRFALVEE